MIGYVQTRHPVTGETIQVVATGKTNRSEAEFYVITPRSNLSVLWLRREDILAE